MTHTPTQNLLTATQIARRLNVRPKTILRWYQTGRIPGVKISHRCLRFDYRKVLAAIDQQGVHA